MRWSFAPLCFALSVCVAQPSAELEPGLLTLARVKAHMAEVLARQPNYTCTEQIERSRRRAPRGKYELVDTMRLEVALVDGKELYSWPGSRKFDEEELTKLVPRGGAIGNGNFALFARTIFLSRAPTFRYMGETELDGRKTVRYEYDVPELTSGFNLTVNQTNAVVGFHGSFWADTTNYDALRLEVIADKIPPQLGLSRSTVTIAFQRAMIGGSEFLLPSTSELVMVSLNGDEDHNRMSFQACRQYTGDSVITFGEAPGRESVAAPVSAPAEPTVVSVPAGVTAEIELETVIDDRHSLVGDLVKATLQQPLKLGKVPLFQKGARLSGRILSLQRHDGHCLLSIQFYEIESGSSRADVTALVEELLTPSRSPGMTHVAERMGTHPGEPKGLLFANSRCYLARGARLVIRTR